MKLLSSRQVVSHLLREVITNSQASQDKSLNVIWLPLLTKLSKLISEATRFPLELVIWYSTLIPLKEFYYSKKDSKKGVQSILSNVYPLKWFLLTILEDGKHAITSPFDSKCFPATYFFKSGIQCGPEDLNWRWLSLPLVAPMQNSKFELSAILFRVTETEVNTFRGQRWICVNPVNFQIQESYVWIV